MLQNKWKKIAVVRSEGRRLPLSPRPWIRHWRDVTVSPCLLVCSMLVSINECTLSSHLFCILTGAWFECLSPLQSIFKIPTRTRPFTGGVKYTGVGSIFDRNRRFSRKLHGYYGIWITRKITQFPINPRRFHDWPWKLERREYNFIFFWLISFWSRSFLGIKFGTITLGKKGVFPAVM